jgi:hypothetical protein
MDSAVPRPNFATAALSLLTALPSCSLLIDTNPDGVISNAPKAGAGATTSTKDAD